MFPLPVICLVFALSSQTFLFGQLVDANPFKNNAGDLKALCKSGSVTLNTITDLLKFVENAKTPVPECSEQTLEALKEMGRIAGDQMACSMAKANDITNFVSNYLKGASADSGQLPKPLVRFAIAYSMQVSIACKRDMISTFIPKAENELERRFGDAFWRFKHYVLDSSPLRSILGPVLQAGDVILPSDFMEAVPGYEAKMTRYISHSAALKKLQRFCERNLQPLYEPILLPLAKLARAGFNYRDLAYSYDEKTGNVYFSDTTRQSRFWSSVVFMCESAKSIEVHVDEEITSGSGNQEAIERELRVLDTQLDQMTGQELDEGDIPEDKLKEPIKPYVSKERVSDQIIGTFDFSLRSLVKSYDANKSERERMKETIMRHSFEIFKRMFKKGHNKPAFRRFFTRLLNKKGSEKDYETAVKGILEMMEQTPYGGSIEFGIAKLGQWSVTGAPWAILWLTSVLPYLSIQAIRGKTIL